MRARMLTLALGLVFAFAGRAGAQTRDVTYIDAAKTTAAFARGAPLLEVENYKIHASRRTEPGMAEIHQRDTDIIYVLDGTATFVTGGRVVAGKMTATDEIRGASIEDGQTLRLAKGDFVVVPAGTPHWFKEVGGTFLYYVVKVPNGGQP